MSEQGTVAPVDAAPSPEPAAPPPPPPVDDGATRLIREIWAGYVPTVVTLARKEIASPSTPDDIYLMIPRMSYLAAAVEDSVNYFREYTAIIDKRSTDGVWFEHDSVPLKSHLPVGVLFDCYNAEVLPWRITLHFTGFPADVLVKSGSPALMQKRYFHSLKQALFLLYGNARLFASLSLQSRVDLWEGICQAKYDKFREVYDMITPSELHDPVEYVPLRCVLVSSAGSLDVLQKPIGLYLEHDAATDEKKGIVEAETPVSMERYGGSQQQGSAKVFSTLRDAISRCLVESEDNYSCKIQGVTVPNKTPLFQLWSVFAHADLFLYITVFLNESET